MNNKNFLELIAKVRTHFSNQFLIKSDLSKYFFLLLIFIGTSLGSCSKNDEDNPNPCPRNFSEELVLSIQDQFTTLPAKVSIFFKVEDKDGFPVAGLLSQNFSIYEKGRNDVCEKLISSFEANAQISSRKQIFAYHTLLVLDLSGSVINTSLSELKVAAKNFIDEVMPSDGESNYSMTILWFDGEDELHELVPASSGNAVLKSAIDGITPGISSDPSTDLYGAVIKTVDRAESILAGFDQEEIISAVSVVIFTDGTDQAGRYQKNVALHAVNFASNTIKFFTIGLGEEIDENILSLIGKHGFVSASNQSELEATFQEIGQVVRAEANSYYLFEYCSPKRDGSGVNSLRIEVEKEARVGSVLTQFNATGFTGGCD